MKIFLFDIDIVLIRLKKYYSKYYENNGHPGTSCVIEEYYNKRLHIPCDEGKTNPLVIIKPFLDKIAWSDTPEEYFYEQYTYEGQFIDRELPDIIKALQKKGNKPFLATDQNHHRKKYLLDDLGLKEYFTGHFVSCDIGYRKVHSEYWDHVTSNLRKDCGIFINNEITFIDDIQHNIEKAQSIGINTIHITSENDIKELKELLAGC